MKTLKIIIFNKAILCFFLSGCATSNSINSLKYEIQNLNYRIDTVQNFSRNDLQQFSSNVAERFNKNDYEIDQFRQKLNLIIENINRIKDKTDMISIQGDPNSMCVIGCSSPENKIRIQPN